MVIKPGAHSAGQFFRDLGAQLSSQKGKAVPRQAEEDDGQSCGQEIASHPVRGENGGKAEPERKACRLATQDCIYRKTDKQWSDEAELSSSLATQINPILLFFYSEDLFSRLELTAEFQYLRDMLFS